MVDPLTVRVKFEQPNAQFLQASSTFSLGIESSASVKKSPQEKCTKGVVASGPFVLKEYVPNQSTTLTKRTGYNWGSSLWNKKGEAYLDSLVFKVVPEAGVRTGSLQSGQVDAIGSVGKADEAAPKAAGVNLQARANPGVVFNLGLNTTPGSAFRWGHGSCLPGGKPRESREPALVGPPGAAASVVDGRTPNGLKIPPRFSFKHLRESPRFALQKTLLQLPGAQSQDYTEQVGDVLALLAGTYRSTDGEEAHVVPGEGAALQVWILGSSGGESAEVAGENGVRFAANYHVSPATVLEAADGYRAAFRSSAELEQPYVSVSAHVVVADDEATARELATGYGSWVRSIRTAEGAIQFPTPDEARRHVWSDADRALVADRVDTQFVGSPAQVADQLEQLRDATSADEVIITTITHDHADRVRSYQLLAEEWARR